MTAFSNILANVICIFYAVLDILQQFHFPKAYIFFRYVYVQTITLTLIFGIIICTKTADFRYKQFTINVITGGIRYKIPSIDKV